MSNSIHNALSAALLKLLHPLVKILLRNGIAYGTFTELAKKVYVDVAFKHHALPGKKQTVSRVSALTGLTRKEAKRLLELEQPDDQGANERYNRTVRVISGWLNDPRYHDDSGKPLALSIDKGSPSFSELVKNYSGDIPTQAMLQTLNDAGCVEQIDGYIHLINHVYIPSNDPVDKINILGTDAGELMSTIDHNLTAEDSQLMYQRKVSNKMIRADAMPEFKKLAAQQAQTLLEELDNWLSQNEQKPSTNQTTDQNDEPPGYVSLGVYYYEQKNSEDEKS